MLFAESEVVELKAEIVGDICKEVIAFANTKGGSLYIGVSNDGSVVGVENADQVTLQPVSYTHLEQAGLRCAGAASAQHTQDEELHPKDRPAARGGGGAAGVQKGGGLPLDVPVPSKRGLSHYTRRGAPQVAAHLGARRVQACALP